MFQHKKDFDFELRKIEVLEKLSNRIQSEYSNDGIRVRRSGDKIEVNFKNLEMTPDGAKKLINLIEFTKSLYLAIA